MPYVPYEQRYDEDGNDRLKIIYDASDEDAFRVSTLGPDLWEVSLPHECQRWTIARDVNRGEFASRDDAALALRSFIAAAQVALKELLTAPVAPEDLASLALCRQPGCGCDGEHVL